MTKFYTYAYLREDRSPYYVGKGCGKRAYRNHGRLPVPPRERILILKKHLTEEEAIKHEIYMIFLFGRKDLGTGCLWNMTDGGDGVGRRVWTPEQRENQSRKHTGKKMSARAREKMREAKIGTTASEETKEKMRVAKIGKTPARNKTLRGTKWWVRGDGTRAQSIECPGEGWKRGFIWKPDEE